MRTAESVVLTDCPPGPGGAVDVDLEIVRVDVDLDLLRLGQHGDRGGGRVDPPLGLGHGDPLHAVGAGLVLQADVGVGALHEEDGLVEAVLVGGVLREDLHLPLLERRVAQVHVVEHAGEQVRLVTAHCAADLHDHVAALVGVLRQQERLHALLERGHPRLGLVDLLAHQLALVPRRLGQHLAGGGDVFAGGGQLVPGPDDLTELLVAPRQVAQAVGVRQGGRVGQLRLDGVVLRLERGHPVVEHAFPGLLVRAGTRRVAPVPAGSVLRRRRPAWPSPCPCALRSDAGSAPPGHRSRPASACR